MANNSSTRQFVNLSTRTNKLVIFDFDGTLGDTRRNIVMTMQQTIAAMGLDYRDETVCAATIGLPLKGCFRQLFPDMDEAFMDRCADTYRTLFEENRKVVKPILFPNVLQTIAELHRRGFVMAIASSRSSRSLHELVNDMGIQEYISMIVGADDVSCPKPNAEPVVKILNALRFSSEETLVVGDMPVDILMGRNAGAVTCGVTYGNASREELESAGAHHIIDNMSLLIDILS